MKRLTRRDFLKLCGTSSVSLALAACDVTPTPTATSLPTSILTPVNTPTPTQTPTITPTPTPKSLGAYKPVTYSKLPRWRGFNLLNKLDHFTRSRNRAYDEWNFDFMVENEFDFVRLATDYKCWTTSFGVYNEQSLREIDQAIAWARERGIHVNLAIHSAPGYSSVDSNEPRTLFVDGSAGDDARRQFAAQWRMFATRYKGISPNELSI